MMDKLLDKTKKLETETESWRRKTEDLEATVKHMKGELANTQQELEFVKESTADTTEWITEGVRPLTSYSPVHTHHHLVIVFSVPATASPSVV